MDTTNVDALLIATALDPAEATQSGYPFVVKRWSRGTPIEEAEVVITGEESNVGVWPARFCSRWLKTFSTSRTCAEGRGRDAEDARNLRRLLPSIESRARQKASTVGLYAELRSRLKLGTTSSSSLVQFSDRPPL